MSEATSTTHPAPPAVRNVVTSGELSLAKSSSDPDIVQPFTTGLPKNGDVTPMGELAPTPGQHAEHGFPDTTFDRFVHRCADGIPVTELPTLTGTPTITAAGTGAPRVGDTLTGDDSAVSATLQGVTKSYQSLRDGTAIPGATATSYTLTNDDAGHSITTQVGATEDGYPDATPAPPLRWAWSTAARSRCRPR